MKSGSILTTSKISASTNISADRGEQLFQRQKAEVYRETDRLFVCVLLAEWAMLLIIALLGASEIWRGDSRGVDLHVWNALVFGGAITLVPAALARVRSGWAFTRYTIAACQMLHSGLLISLSGGQSEAYFHVFCSLVILSFYRDWRVLVPATLAVALGHFVHGAHWPFLTYGEYSGGPWRSLEYCIWVILEDIFLGILCLRSTREMHAAAYRNAAFEASETANQLIMDNSRDVICATDPAGCFVTVSAACEVLWGYKPDELIGKNYAEIVHCDDRENSWLTSLEIMSGHSVTNFENRCMRKDGAVVDVLWSACWSESDGTILQVARDITERKQAQATLQKMNRQLASALQANQLIMDNSQDVICTLDAKGQFLSTNAACQSLWGYKAEELIGRCYLVLVRPEDRVTHKANGRSDAQRKQDHRFRESLCAQGRVDCRCALVGKLVGRG